MARICRFDPQEAAKLAFNKALPAVIAAAEQAGLPVNTEQGQALLQKLAWTVCYHGHVGLYKDLGIFTGIGDDSPYFAQFGGQLLGPGQTVVSGAPVQPPPPPQQPMHVPSQVVPQAPMFHQPQQP
ncbi:MAG: hypothetical protein GZ088_09375, partial [Acidipila sp.]|nr:hypothetical protein [Acidipila sp.]